MEEPCHVMRSRSRHLRWLRPWRRLPRRPPGTQLRRCSRRPPIHPAASQTQSSERAFFCVPMAIPFLSGHSMIDPTSFVSSLSLSNNYAAAYADSLQDWLKGVCVWEHAWSCDSVASPLGRWDRLASVSRSWAPAACLAHPGSCCFPHPPLWACKGCIWQKEKR